MLIQDQRPVLSQRIDPKLIVANTILQLSSLELVQSIESEIVMNPALETLEESGCDGNCIDPVNCPFCSTHLQVREREEAESLDSGEGDSELEGLSYFDIEPNEDYDLFGNLEAETTLQQHLSGLLRATVPDTDFILGEYLINSLDERGWLPDDISLIACDLNLPDAEILRLLAVIQTFDPPGVGARNLQECLLLQLRHLQEESSDRNCKCITNALNMVQGHFDHLVNSRYTKLARALKLSNEDVRTAINYIRTRLNPFPASQFHSPWAHHDTNTKSVIRPDVIIRRGEYSYDIEVPHPESLALSVNPQYREAYLRIKNGDGSFTADERKHYTEYVERAERFIQNINQRRLTLRQITGCIAECQSGFLETGSRQFLRQLTRTHIAHRLDIHESTVSRATANKYVQLPNQEVISFDIFFKGALSIKEAIETIIHEEDSSNPLSDQQIVDLLKQRGIDVARRTVVKYRDEAKILSSTRRRR